MLDHPTLTDPDYTTTLVAWFDGGLHFFESIPSNSDGFLILNLYYASYILFIIVAYMLGRVWVRRGTLRMTRSQVLDGSLFAAIGGIVGARMGEVLFYNPEYFFTDPAKIITSSSGMTVHGAVIGIALALWLWSRRAKIPVLHTFDQLPIILAFNTFIGRLVNFAIGELYGRSTDVAWAMRFPIYDGQGRSLYVSGAGETFRLFREFDGGTVTAEYLEKYPIEQGYNVLGDVAHRFHLGSPDSETWETVRLIVTDPRHPSQLYQALFEGLVLTVILLILRRRIKNVGTLTAVGVMGYGLFRTVTEFFRQPEIQLGFLALGLTMGQVLSLSMVAAGAALLLYLRKHPRAISEIPLPRLPGRNAPESEESDV